MARKKTVQNKVEYICRQLTQLKIVEDLPDADVPTETLVNRATDVLSASIIYLAVHIQHEPGQFGVIGRISNFSASR